MAHQVERVVATSLLIEDRLEIPLGLRTLADFRAWALSDDFPEKGRIDYVQGRIEVDMSPEEVAIGSKSVVNAILRTLDKVISEVVVTGYTREKKREFSGAATVLGNKVVDAVPVPALDQMLQGRVAGLTANSGNGQPGASANRPASKTILNFIIKIPFDY